MKNLFKHLALVTKHRFMVFKFCLMCGIGWQGFIHDLSKYSITELRESLKYFNGSHSPLADAKIDQGYSLAWLHHKGRNKHHHEYWYDYTAPDATPLMPFKYVLEMICDNISAAKTYNGDNYTDICPLEYWLKVRNISRVNPRIDRILIEVYTLLDEKGLKYTLNKERIREIYDRNAALEIDDDDDKDDD